MPSVISSGFGQMALASETDEVLVCLLEIRHSSLFEPIRIASDGVEVDGYHEETGDPIYVFRSRGKKYIRFPFSFIAPGNSKDGDNAKAKLVLAAEYHLVKTVREISDGVVMKAQFVLASSPDVVEYDVPELLLDEVENSAGQIICSLGYSHFYDDDMPAISFTQSITPGLFK